MVWPFSKKDKLQNQQEISNSQPVLFEDISPSPTSAPQIPQQQQQAQTPQNYSQSKEITKFIKSLSLSDFEFVNLVQIPCFRDAGLTGFSAFFVFSTVMFLYHKNVRKAVNWGIGGLMLGSVFGWEQCNHYRRQSQLAVHLAQERYQNRIKDGEQKK